VLRNICRDAQLASNGGAGKLSPKLA
jgi:hypothetical protein